MPDTASGGRRLRVALGIITNHPDAALEARAERLAEARPPGELELVVAVETAGLAGPREAAPRGRVRWLEIPSRRGFGYNRNVIIDSTESDIVAFLDADCEPVPSWLDELLAPLARADIDAVVGRVVVPPSTRLGNAISALGFPAGGSAGYETMFPLGADGLTDNLSTGNCAIRRSVLDEVGHFDESMTTGGEDTELAYRMARAGKRTLFHPPALVVHPARTDLGEFCRWFFRRGRAKHAFVRRVPDVGGHVRRRLESTLSIVRAHLFTRDAPLVLPLMALSLALQQAGFLYELVRSRSARPRA